MQTQQHVTRRAFACGAGLTALSYSRVLGANDRVRMGFIGVGNRGDKVHDAFLEWGDSQTVAICDLRDDYLDLAAKKSRGTPKRYKDYRKLLDDKDVDAVVIATPDHWHALMFIDACNAGKDVYVEKPLSLTVLRRPQNGGDGGAHQARGAGGHAAPLGGGGQGGGRFRALRRHRPGDGGPLLRHPERVADRHRQFRRRSAAQRTEQWDQWLGPAPKVPYNPNRAYYKFRWFYNYSGGQLTNFGVHLMDTMRWCLNLDSPRKVDRHRRQVRDQGQSRDPRHPGGALGIRRTHAGRPSCSATATPRPATSRTPRWNCAAPRAPCIIHPNRWEVVPERLSQATQGANNPVDRSVQRRVRRRHEAGHRGPKR